MTPHARKPVGSLTSLGRLRRPAFRSAAALFLLLWLGSSGCRRRGGTVAASDAGAPVQIQYPTAPLGFSEIRNAAGGTVVQIYTNAPVHGGPGDWFPRNPGQTANTERSSRVQHALGSGFILDAAGHVVTNNHIVGQDRPIWIRTVDHLELAANVIARDEKRDLALLRVQPPPNRPWPTARLGSSSQLGAGQWVVALSNPFGLSTRVEVGVVTATPATTAVPSDSYLRYIQTNIAIHPANSGGPLLNAAGQVVGINCAIGEQGMAVGLALPVERLKASLDALRRYGRIVRSWVGIYADQLSAARAKALGIADGGAIVTGVVAGGPGAVAGLREGDVVIKFGNAPVSSAATLAQLAAAATIGGAIPLSVVRDSKVLTFTLRPQQMPD